MPSPYNHKSHFYLVDINDKGTALIKLRVSNRCKQVDLYTGYVCDVAKWDKGKEKVKQGAKLSNGLSYDVINDKLAELLDFIKDYFNQCAQRSELPDLSDLKIRFNKKYKSNDKEHSNEFRCLFERFIKEKADEKSWSAAYVEAMNRTKDSLLKYKPDASLRTLSSSFMNGYMQYLAETMWNDRIKKELWNLKYFVNWAEIRGYEINNEYKLFEPTLPSSHIAVKYLEIEELKRIIELDLTEQPAMERVRDIFIFQCFTGLRVSDVKLLKKENFEKRKDGRWWIDIETKKDKDRVSFILPKQAVSIYEKYSKNEYEGGYLLPTISDVKYNKHLKTLGKLAHIDGDWVDKHYKLNKLYETRSPKSDISSHEARRTFITTAMNLGISLDVVSKITSHSEIEEMKPYATASIRGKETLADAFDGEF